MSSSSINTIRRDWLKNWRELTSHSLPDLEKEWLTQERGRTGSTTDLHIEFLRDQLGLEGRDYPRSYTDLLRAYASAQGASGHNTNSLLSELYTDSNALTFQALGPRLDGTISTAPQRGTGNATFTRDDSANNGIYVRDFENNYKKVIDGEARFQGARRVENRQKYSEDWSQWTKIATCTIVENITDPLGESNAVQINLPASADDLLGYISGASSTVGAEQRISVWLKADVAGTIRIREGSSGLAPVDVNVTTEWQRFTTDVYTAVSGIHRVSIRRNSAGQLSKVYAAFPQIEDVAGQSNQAPSEYVPTTAAPASKYFWRTNGNTVASNVVTESVGTDLHPTSYKLGAKVFDRYNKWADTTAYSVGDRIIPTTGSGPAGGDGYYYECTVAGTTGGSEPTFDTTIGNTTADGTVTWTNKGYYRIAGYLGEQARTNSITDSYDLTAWTQVGTAVSALDAVGIDGIANKATTLTDNNATAWEYVSKTFTVANDSNTHVVNVLFKKDVSATATVAVHFNLTGGTATSNQIDLNLTNGSSAQRAGSDGYSVEDHGDWWRLIVTVVNNNSGNTSLLCSVYPAVGSVVGTATSTATGSCIVGHTQVELNTAGPSSPIETTGTVETRAKDVLKYAGSNISDTEGSLLLTGTLLYNNGAHRFTGDDTLNRTLLYPAGFNKPSMYDGTTTATSVEAAWDQSYPQSTQRAGSRWNSVSSVMQPFGSGVSAAESAYDGSFDFTNLVVNGGYIDSFTQVGIVSDLLLYNKDLGTTKLESMTEFD